MKIGVFLGFGVITREATLPARALARSLGGEVQWIGISRDRVSGVEPGESFQPDVELSRATPEVLVIPGGFGCRPLSTDRVIVDRLRTIIEQADGVLAISTGTLLLAATGLVSGRTCAGHWLTAEELAPHGVTLSANPVESAGRLFTAGGSVAALDAAETLADAIRYGPGP